MAYTGPYIGFSAKANSDLSTKQYCFVKLVGDNLVDICSAVTDKPIGVLQGTPTAGQMADVWVAGISKVVAGAAIAADALIGTTTAGTAAAYVPGTDTTKYIVGHVIQSNANAGGYVTATIDCMAPTRGA